LEYLQIFVETIVGFSILFILTKVLGKTQITQITAFDFIAALVLGELVGNALYDKEVGISQVIFAVFLWGSLIYIIEWVTQKYKGSRAFLEGRPSVIIYKGKLQYQKMKKGRLDINQLQHLLRSKEVFSIQEVDYAVLETDGTVSVLRKTTEQTPSRGDLNLTPQTVELARTLINDGEILWDNMREEGLDEGWLEQELKKQQFDSAKDVLYAEYKKGEALHVQAY